MPASGGRSISKRLTSSAAKCCASAAEPPLPQASTLPPWRSASASSVPARVSGAFSAAAASSLSFALSANCAATRAARATALSFAFCPPGLSVGLPPSGRVPLALDPARRLGVLRQPADARAQALAAIEPPRRGGVLAPRQIAELVPAPRDAHRVRVVRVVRFAAQLERVAQAQLVPHVGRCVVPKAGERRALHENPHLLRHSRLREGKHECYSPKASRTHCTLSPSTRKTSKRTGDSG